MISMISMTLVTRVAAVAVSCAAAGSCGGTREFACLQDDQCGVGAVCQADGWCSFGDDSCSSGLRYGEHAGDGLGGACVPKGDDTPTTGGSAIGSGSGDETGGGASSTLALTGSVDDDATGPPATTTSTGPALDESSSGGDSDTGEPIDPALVAWYTFDDPRDPYADASGNRRHAWCDDDQCPQHDVGVVGGGIVLDGIDDHLHVDHDPGLELTESFTVALWVSVDAATLGEFHTITSKPLGELNGNSWEIGFPGSMSLYAGAGGTDDFSSLLTPLPELGVWHHLAFVWGDGAALLYLDGAEVDSGPTVTVTYDEHVMMIGADIDNEADDNFLTGKIDDLRIYARVLDSAEVAALASDGA